MDKQNVIDGLDVILGRRGEKITQGDILIVEAAIMALARKPRAEGEATKWIPVRERTPPEAEKVLACWQDGYQYCAHYLNGEWLNTAHDVMPSQKIIAWMPLPSPYMNKERP